MTLPPNVKETAFRNAIDKFRQAVGEEWVFTSQEDVDLYRDSYSPFKGEPARELVAAAAVAPNSVEAVQAIVRIANEFKIPIYPISTGKNLGYGGSAPAMSGSVVLDLKRMNRILEVDEDNAYALVEPGVTYFDLYDYFEEHGHKLWVDTPLPGWGSLIGNALDHGNGWTSVKYRDHFDAHCGMEVVLPNAEILRTGMGAMPNTKSWQQFKPGYGAWVDGIFSQSSLGVVTKMGFWLMPQPEASLMGSVSVSKYGDLIPLMKILNRLEYSDLFNGMSILFGPLTNNKYILGPGERSKPVLPGLYEVLGLHEEPPYPELEAFCRANNTGIWGVRLQFYGPEEVLKAQWAYCKKKFTVIDGVIFEDGQILKMPVTRDQRETAHKDTYGIPNLDVFNAVARSATRPEPSFGHYDFAPIIPRNGEDVLRAIEVFGKSSRRLGIEAAVPILINFQRSIVYEMSFLVSRDAEINRKTRWQYSQIVKIAAENGWGAYRSLPAFYDEVMNTYSFNDHILRRFHETLKDAIDPHGIISPGRYGLWPRNMRGSKNI
jgi:4-cresol dehydrogenase (hydroxylating)